MPSSIKKSSPFVAPARSLKIIAALVWYLGGFVLLLKGSSLLLEADAMKPEENWPWIATVAGFLFGGLKAKFLFTKNCQKNLDRISALAQPKLWQFFRPGFFVFLAAMILGGARLSSLAHNNYPLLIGVAILDLSIATALLGSSHIFWKQKAFMK